MVRGARSACNRMGMAEEVTVTQAQEALRAWYGERPQAPLKQYLKEQWSAHMERLFGYHSLQIGLSDWYALGVSLNIPQRVALETGPCRFPPEVPVVYGQPWQLPFQSDVFDVIFLPHTLEWVDDLERTWGELHRVLRPQGTLMIVALHPGWGHRSWKQEEFVRQYPWVRNVLPISKVRQYGANFGFCELNAYVAPQALFQVRWRSKTLCAVPTGHTHVYALALQKQVCAPYLIRPCWSMSQNFWKPHPVRFESQNRKSMYVGF